VVLPFKEKKLRMSTYNSINKKSKKKLGRHRKTKQTGLNTTKLKYIIACEVNGNAIDRSY